MCIVLAAEIPALDGTGVAFTLGGALHVDNLTCLELIDSQLATDVQIASLVYAKFPETATTACIRLGEVSSHCLSHPAAATLAGRYLNRDIAVVIQILHLSNSIWFCFDDSHGNGHAFFIEDSCHTALFTYQSNCHWSS